MVLSQPPRCEGEAIGTERNAFDDPRMLRERAYERTRPHIPEPDGIVAITTTRCEYAATGTERNAFDLSRISADGVDVRARLRIPEVDVPVRTP